MKLSLNARARISAEEFLKRFNWDYGSIDGYGVLSYRLTVIDRFDIFTALPMIGSISLTSLISTLHVLFWLLEKRGAPYTVVVSIIDTKVSRSGASFSQLSIEISIIIPLLFPLPKFPVVCWKASLSRSIIDRIPATYRNQISLW